MQQKPIKCYIGMQRLQLNDLNAGGSWLTTLKGILFWDCHHHGELGLCCSTEDDFRFLFVFNQSSGVRNKVYSKRETQSKEMHVYQ